MHIDARSEAPQECVCPDISRSGVSQRFSHCMPAAQYLTLLFVGFISASSMRMFLHDMRKVRSTEQSWLYVCLEHPP